MAQVNLMGKTILGYTENEKLGMGAFGTVYKVIKRNPSGEYVRALKHITIPTDKQYTSLLNSMGGDVSKVDNYFVEMLNKLNVCEKKQLFVLPSSNKNVYLSARNLKRTNVVMASNLNTYGIMNSDVLVISEGSLEIISEILTKKEA